MELLTMNIVISGSPHEPMTRSIACDLEKRGYIIFVTVTSTEEQHVIESEAREDIRPLWFDLSQVRSYITLLHLSRPVLFLINHIDSSNSVGHTSFPLCDTIPDYPCADSITWGTGPFLSAKRCYSHTFPQLPYGPGCSYPSVQLG